VVLKKKSIKEKLTDDDNDNADDDDDDGRITIAIAHMSLQCR